MKFAKMADVAARAGVSVSTVSHVINGTRKVKEETRERVFDAIRELNYSPDIAARSFKTGRKNMIGFIVPDISNSFYSYVIEIVEEILEEHGYTLIVVNSGEKLDRELAHLQFLTSGIVDGCLIASTAERYDELSGFIPDGFPVVFLDRPIENNPLEQLCFSTERAMKDAVSFLVSSGHRKIGLITGPKEFSSSHERRASFRKAIEAEGVPFSDKLTLYGARGLGASIPLADNLLAKGCTAIIAADNSISYDIMNHLMLKIMNCETVVVSYCASSRDEFNMASNPKIVQPTAEFGLCAARAILDMVVEPKSLQERTASPFETVFKQS